MRDQQLNSIGVYSRCLLSNCVGAQLPAHDRAGAGERKSAYTENENRNYGFDESIAVRHPATLADHACTCVIRALRAKSNYLLSVASP